MNKEVKQNKQSINKKQNFESKSKFLFWQITVRYISPVVMICTINTSCSFQILAKNHKWRRNYKKVIRIPVYFFYQKQ